MTTENIIQCIQDIFAGADEKNWIRIQNALTENVLLDYTSMTGNQPSLLSPEQITTAWANFLPGFDKTQHCLSNFIIEQTDHRTLVTFDGKADHFINDQVWTVEGNYVAEIQNNKVRSL